jgi:hypothetical protein
MHRSMQVLLLFEMATLPVTFTICPRPAKVMKGKSHDDHPPSTTALPHVESQRVTCIAKIAMVKILRIRPIVVNTH